MCRLGLFLKVFSVVAAILVVPICSSIFEKESFI